MDFKDKELTQNIIGCAFKVHSTLGRGFLEKVYEKEIIGEYYADIYVGERVICDV